MMSEQPIDGAENTDLTAGESAQEPTAAAPEATAATPEAPAELVAAEPTVDVQPESAPEAPAEAQAESAAEAPAEAAPAMSAEEREEQARKREEERKRKEEERKQRDEAFAALEGFKQASGIFEITIGERVKGGLRGVFQGLRVFLPASQVGLRKNVSDDELQQLVGQTVRVKVHELQSDDAGHKSAVVSRREILLDELWNTVVVGAVVDGVVSSVTAFGAFVNIGGVEGLLHVSRMSRSRVTSPSDVVRKGDKLKVTIVEIDREKKKIALSHKEHEADPWVGVEQAYPAGKRIQGTVQRITDFGAYVQVSPKIEGLLRISELSWTRRVKHPSEVVSVGQTIDVEVLSADEQKHQLALGYKQTQPNPWLTLSTELPSGSDVEGTVQSVSTQGAVIRVRDTFDGFMPRSKMAGARGGKTTLSVGDTLACVVVDLSPENASLILAMRNEDGSVAGQQSNDWQGGGRQRDNDRDRDRERPQPRHEPAPPSPGVTLGDMLRDADKSSLGQ